MLEKHDPPEPGEVYQRDGKCREVEMVAVNVDTLTYDVTWRHPGHDKTRRCWCSTWMEWASKAERIK